MEPDIRPTDDTRRLVLLRQLIRHCLGDYLRIAEADTFPHLLPDEAAFPDVSDAHWHEQDLGVVALVPTRDGSTLTLLLQPELEPRPPGETGRYFGRWFLPLEARWTQPVLLSVSYLRRGRPGPNLESAAVFSIGGMELVRIFYTAFGLADARADFYLERPEPLSWALASAMRSVRLSPPELRQACLDRITGLGVTSSRSRKRQPQGSNPTSVTTEVQDLLVRFVELSLPA